MGLGVWGGLHMYAHNGGNIQIHENQVLGHVVGQLCVCSV